MKLYCYIIANKYFNDKKINITNKLCEILKYPNII